MSPARALFLGFALAFTTAGCHPFEPASCDDVGTSHCSADGSCKTDLECRSGEVCVPDQSGGSGTCELARGGARSSTLIDGFSVPQLELVAAAGSTDGTRFTWTSEPQFQLVRCALFACHPVILSCSGGSAQIPATSADRCVLGLLDVIPPGDEIDVGALGGLPPAATAPLISSLQLGCWAYDDVGIVEASSLAPVPPAALPALFAAPCTAASDGQNCVLSDATLGSCLGATCRQRCASAADCGDGGADTCMDRGSCDVRLCSAAEAP